MTRRLFMLLERAMATDGGLGCLNRFASNRELDSTGENVPSLKAMRPVVPWAIACSCVVVLVAGCTQGRAEDMSTRRPYAAFIGAEYQVIADDLYAYGIRKNYDDKSVSWVILIPALVSAVLKWRFDVTSQKGASSEYSARQAFCSKWYLLRSGRVGFRSPRRRSHSPRTRSRQRRSRRESESCRIPKNV